MAQAIPIVIAIYGMYTAWQQSKAATTAAGIQGEASEAALEESARQFNASQAFAEKQWATTQAQMAPFIATGQGAASNLSYLLGIKGVSPNMGATMYGGGGTGTGGKTDPGGGKDRFTDDPNYSGKYQGIDPDSGIGQADAIVAGLDQRYATTGGIPSDARREARLWNIQQTSGSPNPQNPTWYRGPTSPPPSTVAPTRDRMSGKTVTMTAPNGETQDVPEELADYYALRGAGIGSAGRRTAVEAR